MNFSTRLVTKRSKNAMKDQEKKGEKKGTAFLWAAANVRHFRHLFFTVPLSFYDGACIPWHRQWVSAPATNASERLETRPAREPLEPAPAFVLRASWFIAACLARRLG
jgi:hypothetical protein